MASNYEHLSKEQLVSLLQKRDSTRKLGLVWERDEIEHERALNDDFVMLELDEKLSVGQPPYQNLLIEGDNFDALRYLHIAYKGRIKCIYIDPPYNTGNKDFVYNDRFIDKEDAYKHSTWLEFLYRRLTLAKDLLTEDGVLLVSINDENRSKLELLMDQVFPRVRIGSLVWKTRSGSNDESGHQLSVDHEHILVYGRERFSFRGVEKNFDLYKNPDNDLRGRWKTGDLSQPKTYHERPNAYYPLQDPETGVWYPCNPSRVWAFASETRLDNVAALRAKTMEQYIRDGKVIFPDPKKERVEVWETRDALLDAIRRGDVPVRPKSKTPLLAMNLPDLDFWVGRPVGFGRPWFKRHLRDVQSEVRPVSSWIKGASDDSDVEDNVIQLIAHRSGTGEHSVNEILGFNAFNFPKPPSLMLNLIRQASGPEDIVLDFFAGSGTTGHAVLMANQIDGEPRKFILVSNKEAVPENPEKNVCKDVCAARLRAVINGYENVTGTGGGFAYMQTKRVAREALAFDIRHDQIWFALQQLHANAVSPFNDCIAFQILEGDGNGLNILYMPKVDHPAIESLKEWLDQSLQPTIIYTWQPGIIQQRFNYEHIQVQKIPDYLTERFGRGEV